MARSGKRAIDEGMILSDTWEITHRLGAGGMGAVWGARHLRLMGKKAAIKVLHPEVATDAESVARFHREAQIASRLGHPNIISILDIEHLPDGMPYLVLEYLEGESLAERLTRGPIPVDQTLALVRQIGSALAAAHAEDIIHRDLKPQNIFLCPTESGGYATEVAKVLDFGISKIRGSTTVKTQTTSMLGTPQYMAPEQATGNHDIVDARTDVFAMGVMVYEMLSGIPPFQGNTVPEVVFKVVYEDPAALSKVAPSLDSALVAAVHQAMAKPREQRFATISDLVEALTGDPLTTLRGGAAVSPVARKPLPPSINTGKPGGAAPGPGGAGHSGSARSQEAYAATMAPSDDLATWDTSGPLAAVTPRIGAGPHPARATAAGSGASVVTDAATLSPGSGDAILPDAILSGARAPAGAGEPAARGPARRPLRRARGWIIGVGLLAAVAAAGMTFGAIKKLSSPADPGPTVAASGAASGTALPAAQSQDSGPGATAAASAAAADQGGEPDQGDQTGSPQGRANGTAAPDAGPDSGPNGGAGGEEPRTTGEPRESKDHRAPRSGKSGRSDQPDDERDGEVSSEAAELLARAQENLDLGRFGRAKMLANRAIGVQDHPGVRAQVVRIYCRMQDLTLANSYARGLPRGRRNNVIRYCKKHDMHILQ